MLCEQCNSEIGDAMFCPNCGTNNAPSDIPPAIPPATPVASLYQSAQETPYVSVSVPADESFEQPYYNAQSASTSTSAYYSPASAMPQPQPHEYVNTANVAAQNGYQQYLPQNNPNSQPAYNPTPVAMEDPGKSNATTSLIWGIVSLIFGWLPGIIAIIFANKYKRIGNGANKGTATAGKIMGIIGICISVFVTIIILLIVLTFAGIAASI